MGSSLRGERRSKVAEEAARLLYYNLVEDYKSAKEAASKSLGIRAFPSNLEVAIELDKLADGIEGESRRDLLINLRKTALRIMDKLAFFNPKLIGSVWRGTSKKGSDIDVEVYSENPETVVDIIRKEYGDAKMEYTSKTSEGITKRFLHICFTVPSGYGVEVIVKSPEETYERRKCEIYGDYIIGLTRDQLRELLEKDALKRFLPENKKD